MNSTLVTVLNLILSAGIFVLALFTWSRLRSTLALFVGIAFGLFAVSHLVLVLGLGEAAQGLIVVVRVLGYALVLVALYKEMLAKREPPGGAKPR
jgi:hypothetical protein